MIFVSRLSSCALLKHIDFGLLDVAWSRKAKECLANYAVIRAEGNSWCLEAPYVVPGQSHGVTQGQHTELQDTAAWLLLLADADAAAAAAF